MSSRSLLQYAARSASIIRPASSRLSSSLIYSSTTRLQQQQQQNNIFSINQLQSKRSYHPKVIDHYQNPRNVGTMDKNLENVGTGLVGAPACGDVMRLQIKVNDETGVIEDVKFKTFGCGSAIASSSYATELVKGMTLDEASEIKNTTIAKELSLPPVKLHCSMLAEDAIKSAIKDYKSKRKNLRTPTLGPNSTANSAKEMASA